jgi:uncharacterized protein (TIGR04222 family)
MKLVEHRSLWSAIQQFPLDDPDAALNFSHKLAAQQKWSAAFTQKAIEEYRKFIFLCCIAPKGASPSKVVDEVWHLHLTYTQSYWIEFCKNTLGKDIHHHPSKGGNEEDHKHEQWYVDTLQLYEMVFESPPTADIWPPPKKEPPQIPKPTPRKQSKTKALIILLLLLPFAINAFLYHQLSPFALKGLQFLVFFPLLAICSILCFVILQYRRNRLLIKLVTDDFPTDATIFQVTHFLYGKHRAIQTAIIDLTRRSLLEVVTQFLIVRKNRYIEQDNELNPLVKEFLMEKEEYVNYDMIAFNWYKEQDAVHPILEGLHHLAYQKETPVKRFHFLIIPLAIGILRIFQGLANNKPVDYLMFEMLAVVLLSLIVESAFSRKRMLFNKAKELSKAHYHDQLLHPDEVVNDFAFKGNSAIQLFGDGIILAAIFAAYPAINHTRLINVDLNYGGFSSGDGCSSGGGSCSGGGCGGGCGGCGGGD